MYKMSNKVFRKNLDKLGRRYWPIKREMRRRHDVALRAEPMILRRQKMAHDQMIEMEMFLSEWRQKERHLYEIYHGHLYQDFSSERWPTRNYYDVYPSVAGAESVSR